MKNMTLHNIAKACGGKLCAARGLEMTLITGAVLDSRKVEPGNLFFAVKGEKADGHDFIGQVYEKRAACVVCEREPAEPVPYILVKDCLQALKDIAEFYRQQLRIPVIGITGSVGKTSTKECIAGVLETKFRVLKTEGNFNNEIGLPLTILRIREEHEVAVVEMGISDFGEMHRLSKVARPDICVLTNIGQCHLENLKSREGILKAKTEIFDYMQEDGLVCLNGNDDMLAAIKEVKGRPPYRFGVIPEKKKLERRAEAYGNTLDVVAQDVENKGLFGSEAVFWVMGEACKVKIPLPGAHMVINGAAAACVGKLLGLSIRQIYEGLAGLKPVGGRSHIIRRADRTLIDDCYNANPVSMKAAIDLLHMAITRRVAILGDMFELGENSDAMHYEVGAYAANADIELLLCAGENAKHIYEGAVSKKSARQEVFYFPDRASLEEMLAGRDTLLKWGDTILIKASHGMAFENIVELLNH